MKYTKNEPVPKMPPPFPASSVKRKLFIGLMSGTSADGIDAALVEVRGSGTATSFRQIAFLTRPYSAEVKREVLRLADRSTARVDSIARCDFFLGELFADAARRVARKAGISMRRIHAIGSHGHTIHHLPATTNYLGKPIRATLQIGNISVIAKRTGVCTVGDFRSGDVAVGGTGAPLVPIFDFLALRSSTKNRASLNLGGIANITFLPKHCTLEQVSAFDTGPGNMVIDSLMRRLMKKEMDRGGDVAGSGTIIPSLLRWMMRHPYLRLRVPKSTGRETFGKRFVDSILRRSGGKARKDIVTTATEFTALSVYYQCRGYSGTSFPIDELIVSGGGIHNRYLMSALERYFYPSVVSTSDAFGIDPDAKEAVCFALLANETLNGNPSNVKGATGARRSTVLGAVAFP